jgi:hypothetical protein
MLRHAPKALVVALAFALVSIGSPSGARGDSQGAANLVAGTGTISTSSCSFCAVLGMIHVNAQSGPGGVDPRGHFWIRLENGGGEFGGNTVTCLNVAGMSAGLVGQIDTVKVPVANPTFQFTEGNYVYIRVTDMGSPGTLDLVNVDPGTATPPAACPGKDICCNISQGNYVIHDQPVLDLAALDQLNLQIAQFEAQADDPFGG